MNRALRTKGVLFQVVGVIVLLEGMHGFGVLSGLAHLCVLVACIGVFALCLSKGCMLIKKSKEEESNEND